MALRMKEIRMGWEGGFEEGRIGQSLQLRGPWEAKQRRALERWEEGAQR